MPDALPFKLEDYLELVDWRGRIVRDDKRGAIASDTPAILQRLGISMETWGRINRQFISTSALCFSCPKKALLLKNHFGLKRLRMAG